MSRGKEVGDVVPISKICLSPAFSAGDSEENLRFGSTWT